MNESMNWLRELADHMTPLIEPAADRAPIGCHYGRFDDCWEVTFFLGRTEIVGGEHDGKAMLAPFVVDVRGVLELMDSVDQIEWQSDPLADDDELGGHIAIRGRYRGESILLRILSTAPERFEASQYANLYDGRLINAW